MYTLPVSQCPKCELRFGSPSERDLHLREDHRPPLQRHPEPSVAPAEKTSEPVPAVRRDVRLHPYVVRGILAAAILAVVAAVSWQAAALLTVFLVAGVAGWALRNPEP
jgi:hypothetical protein